MLRLRPDSAPIWVQYGHALKESGAQRRAAEQAYRSALALQPGVADTHLQLGHLLKIDGREAEAAAEYFAAALLDPDLPSAQLELSGLDYVSVTADRLLQLERQRKEATDRLAANQQALETAELQLYRSRTEHERVVKHNDILAVKLRDAEQRGEELTRINAILRADVAEVEAELSALHAVSSGADRAAGRNRAHPVRRQSGDKQSRGPDKQIVEAEEAP